MENRRNPLRLLFVIVVLMAGVSSHTASAQVLDKQRQLAAQTFWDNRD